MQLFTVIFAVNFNRTDAYLPLIPQIASMCSENDIQALRGRGQSVSNHLSTLPVGVTSELIFVKTVRALINGCCRARKIRAARQGGNHRDLCEQADQIRQQQQR
jgi:hypothetical protein